MVGVSGVNYKKGAEGEKKRRRKRDSECYGTGIGDLRRLLVLRLQGTASTAVLDRPETVYIIIEYIIHFIHYYTLFCYITHNSQHFIFLMLKIVCLL